MTDKQIYEIKELINAEEAFISRKATVDRMISIASRSKVFQDEKQNAYLFQLLKDEAERISDKLELIHNKMKEL